jgi:glycosyltransferase involved in cell wall biosynthesis
MRILHVILTKGFTGAERSTAESCNYQVTQHPTACVMRFRQSRHRRGGIASLAANLDPRVQVLRMPRRWFARPVLERHIERFAPDVIHAHVTDAEQLIASLRTKAAKIATLHLDEFKPYHLQFDGLVTIARWQARLIPESYRGAVIHWPNSYIPHRRLDAAEKRSLRAELGLRDSDYVIGGVGSLIARKGWDTLIKAFRQANLPEARLVIIGDGRDRAAFEALADQRVLLPGFRANVKDYFQIFDLLVCPSRREAFGRVLIEALDAGTPVVASDTDGCREILSQYPGDLFPVDDVTALTSLLRRHYEAHTPRVTVDLSQFEIANSGRVLLEGYAEAITKKAARGDVAS